VVAIHGLSFGYSKKLLFQNLDLTLEPGNIYGLLGKNGAGKTSLLKLMCGLRFARSGGCRVLDVDPGSRPVHLLEEIFYVPEELGVPPLTPAAYERVYAPFYPRFDRNVFHQCMKEFEIENDERLSRRSFGEKKKFLLSFALATGCRMLLLDEPTNGLDIPSKSQFRKLLAGTLREDQIILVSTHQVRDMQNVIDPIIILDDGRIIFKQPMEEVTRRLSMRLETEEPSDAGLLFSEKTLGGWLTVRAHTGREETNVDIEVLFRTVIGNRSKIESIFAAQTEVSHE